MSSAGYSFFLAVSDDPHGGTIPEDNGTGVEDNEWIGEQNGRTERIAGSDGVPSS